MSVPDYFHVVEQVYRSGQYDLFTKEGCGRFTEDIAGVLYNIDARFGHLKKRPGQNQWNGHAVDAVLYLEDGAATAVDIIASSESVNARPQWNLDAPRRYSSVDWYAPNGEPAPAPQPPAEDPVARAVRQVDEIHAILKRFDRTFFPNG